MARSGFSITHSDRDDRPSLPPVKRRKSAPRAPAVAFRPVKSVGRAPRPRTAPDRPLTAVQQAVLNVVRADGNVSPPAIAARLGRSRDGVVSSLYAIADRGLIVKDPAGGWRLP